MDARMALDAGMAIPGQTVKLPAAAAQDADQLRRTADEFESVFLAQMLQPMLSGLTPEAPFGGGPGEDIWQSMLVREYGKAIVARGGIGIADAVMREILQTQEAAAPDQRHDVEKELPR